MRKQRRKAGFNTVVEVFACLRDDTEVTAEVELEYDPGEQGPDGIGRMPGGYTSTLLSHDAPFELTPEEEQFICEKAVEDFDVEGGFGE